MADQWGGKRKREKSPVIETSEALAFQNISTLVQAMESEAWGQTSKSQKTEDTLESLDLTASSSAIEVYQALAIVPAVNFKFTFEELGVLSRDEVLPYVDTSRMRDDGIVKVNSAMFSRGAVEGAKEYPIDISIEGLKKLVDFPVSGHCAQIVAPSVIEKIFSDNCGYNNKKDVWKAIAPWFGFNLKNAQGRSEGWVVDDFRKFTLENILMGQSSTCECREELKEELAKAQEQAALAARREETIRLEKDALQKEYSRDKADWESKNHKLAEEVNQLHEDMKRVSTKEELVRAELSEIRSQMEVSAKNTGEATGLKLELEAKEEELRKLHEADKKIRQRLKTAKKKGKELEGELKKMPAGVLVKLESRVMELLKSGKKWKLSCYPKVFDAKDLTEWKGSVVPVPCTFCKGLIAPGTDLRIPTCGHSYHISCVCSSFGLNHLACWAESCSQTLPTPWIHEFCLDRQVDLEALKERYMCSWDMRSFPPNAELFETEQDMLHITGVPQMRAQRTKWLVELGKALDEKTLHNIHASKSGARLLLFAPQHTIPGTQFRLWSRKNGGFQITE
ncbi:hypothetical protein R1sor_009394 [Riccia sorocarpa]|uniref:RING-type domain-containing protein n=1 Tax=Riccia sorocarpa TaxID=122646 RepID=A0ABD3HV87_9MARC